jgi:hypothetical protein
VKPQPEVRSDLAAGSSYRSRGRAATKAADIQRSGR